MRTKQIQWLSKKIKLPVETITEILQTRQNEWFDSDEYTGKYKDEGQYKLRLLPDGLIEVEYYHRMTSPGKYFIGLDGKPIYK